jgi:hypothetical protein
MPEETSICQVRPSTVFVFDSPTFQAAATSVYAYKSTIDALPANEARGKKYQFKSDYERLQYLMGLYATTPAGF